MRERLRTGAMPAACCAVGCGCTKGLYDFTKDIADIYAKQSGKGGGTKGGSA